MARQATRKEGVGVEVEGLLSRSCLPVWMIIVGIIAAVIGFIE